MKHFKIRASITALWNIQTCRLDVGRYMKNKGIKNYNPKLFIPKSHNLPLPITSPFIERLLITSAIALHLTLPLFRREAS